MPAISEWLIAATRQLKSAGITSARLDAEIILAHTLRRTRTYLHAHGDEPLASHERDIADARLAIRADRTPLAYIIGHKEFFGRLFKTTSATLIPRPESETIISLLLELAPLAEGRLVDVGTGTGCLGITAKLEAPLLDVTLTDISRHALVVAQQNAASHHADVKTLSSNLLAKYPLQARYILANLPYVDTTWECSPETAYEPQEALFTQQGGLKLIKELVHQASTGGLEPGGLLFIEADKRQHETIIHHAQGNRLSLVRHEGFILVFTLQSD